MTPTLRSQSAASRFADVLIPWQPPAASYHTCAGKISMLIRLREYSQPRLQWFSPKPTPIIEHRGTQGIGKRGRARIKPPKICASAQSRQALSARHSYYTVNAVQAACPRTCISLSDWRNGGRNGGATSASCRRRQASSISSSCWCSRQCRRKPYPKRTTIPAHRSLKAVSQVSSPVLLSC